VKKEYQMLIRSINKKNFGKYFFALVILAIIMMSLLMVPTDCEAITGSYVSFGDKKLTFKRCKNIYGFDMGMADFNE
jgi:hypothetical protein